MAKERDMLMARIDFLEHEVDWLREQLNMANDKLIDQVFQQKIKDSE